MNVKRNFPVSLLLVAAVAITASVIDLVFTKVCAHRHGFLHWTIINRGLAEHHPGQG
jgi:hypothetical protein